MNIQPDRKLPGAAGSTVNAGESTASTSYVALATAQAVTAVVPTSGRVLLILAATVSSTGTGGNMSVAMSGANTSASTPDRAINHDANANTSGLGSSLANAVLLTGLTPGATTFTVQAQAGTGTLPVRRRTVVVIPA